MRTTHLARGLRPPWGTDRTSYRRQLEFVVRCLGYRRQLKLVVRCDRRQLKLVVRCLDRLLTFLGHRRSRSRSRYYGRGMRSTLGKGMIKPGQTLRLPPERIRSHLFLSGSARRNRRHLILFIQDSLLLVLNRYG